MECNWIKEPIYRISSPTLFFSLSFPPCTCSTPTPPRFNLSLKGWTNSPSKLFSSMSLSSQITQVATHLLQHSSLNTLFILLLYLLYAFYNPPFHPCKKKKKRVWGQCNAQFYSNHWWYAYVWFVYVCANVWHWQSGDKHASLAFCTHFTMGFIKDYLCNIYLSWIFWIESWPPSCPLLSPSLSLANLKALM